MSASFNRNTAATGNYDAGFWDDAEMVERPDGSPILEPLDRAPTYHTIADATSLSTDGRTEEEDSTMPPPPYEEGPSEVADEEKVDKKEQTEEVAPDVLVDVLFEEVINNYNLGGPFVRRLKAYRTSPGEIVVREEKIQIEVGTKLEMDPFANCAFCSDYSGGFTVWNHAWTTSIGITRSKITKTSDGCTFNNLGPCQSMNIGNKATGMNYGSNGMTQVFNVEGRVIKVSDDGSTVSNSPSPMNSGQVINNFIGMDMDQVNRDAQSAMEAGLMAAEEGRRAGAAGMRAGQLAAEQGRRAAEQGRRAAEQGRRAGEEGRRAGEAGMRAGQLAAEQGRRAAEQGRRIAAAATNATQNMFVPTVSTAYSGRGMWLNNTVVGQTTIGTTKTYINGKLVELNGTWL